MKFLINKIFNSLEDPEQPFIGRTIKMLQFWGLLLPENKKLKVMYMTIHISIGIFICTQYIDIFVNISDKLQLLRNSKYSIIATVNLSKIVVFILRQKDLKSVIDFIKEVDVERRRNKDENSKNVINKYTNHNKTITYIFWCITYCTVFLMILQPGVYSLSAVYRENVRTGVEKRVEVLNAWLPVNKDTITGYAGAICLQIFMAVYAGGWISSFDICVTCIMMFFCLEIELLKRDCQLLFGTLEKPVSVKEAKVRLAKLHRRHNDLVKYSELFDSCLSPIMLLYVTCCSFVLCTTLCQLTIETSAMQRLITAEYLTFTTIELLLYCWYGNEVFYISMDLMLGPYQSIWWSRSLPEQKNVFLLTAKLNKTIMFNVGPFTNITINTFVNILKGAYSYYTLLNQSQ